MAPDASLARSRRAGFTSANLPACAVDPRSPLRQAMPLTSRFDDPSIAREISEVVDRAFAAARASRSRRFPLHRAASGSGAVWRDIIDGVGQECSGIAVFWHGRQAWSWSGAAALRRRLRRGIFVVAVVGRPRRLVSRRARITARHRRGHRLSRSTIRSAPRPAISERTDLPPIYRHGCAARPQLATASWSRWASNLPRARI